MGVFNIILCVILMCHFGNYRCDGVKININPTKTIATTVKDVQITCLPGGDEDNGKQLTVIELSRNDQDTIVFVSQCGNISFGHDTSKRFQATGHIDKVPSQSHLIVTLVNPESQDTGIYTCTMVYINTEGHIETETNSGNLQVENLDVKALEGLLNDMKDRIASLETENKELHEKDSQLVAQNGKSVKELTDKITVLELINTKQSLEFSALKDKDSQLVAQDGKSVKELTDKITVLEQINTNQSLEFAAFKDKVFSTTYFMATTLSRFTTTSGSIVVFPGVRTRRGAGYDEYNGVFTSPVSGLYAFHVVARIASGCFFQLDLMVNERKIARLVAYDNSSSEQSSISSLVELQAGERVFCKANKACDLYGERSSMFIGHLIQSF